MGIRPQMSVYQVVVWSANWKNRVFIVRGDDKEHCKKRVRKFIKRKWGDTSGRYVGIEIGEKEFNKNVPRVGGWEKLDVVEVAI